MRTASATYPVEIAAGSASALPALLDAVHAPARRFVVSTAHVWELHGEAVRGVTQEEPIILPDGERYKNVTTVMRIYDALIKAVADRASCIVALGGGVVGDMAGFAAATYLRGVPVVQIPTTLLAQIDSAIGGKTGVNHPLGKNLIGAFHQPLAVLVDPLLLATLPRREFRAGLYEVVKYGVIASRGLFDRLTADLPKLFAREAAALLPVVAECCQIKADVVGRDEREAGPRRALELRPHRGPRARSGDQVPALPPWRSRGLRHARRRGARGPATGVCRGGPPGAGRADRENGAAAPGCRSAG